MNTDEIINDINLKIPNKLIPFTNISINIQELNIMGVISVNNINKIDIQYRRNGNYDKICEIMTGAIDNLNDKVYEIKVDTNKTYKVNINDIICTNTIGPYGKITFNFRGKIKYFDYFKCFNSNKSSETFFDDLPEDLVISIIHCLNPFDVVTFINSLDFSEQKLNNVFHNAVLRHPTIRPFQYEIILKLTKKCESLNYNWYHVYVYYLSDKQSENSRFVYGYFICEECPIIFECSNLSQKIFSTSAEFFYQKNSYCDYFRKIYQSIYDKDFRFIEYLDIIDHLHYSDIERLVDWGVEHNFKFSSLEGVYKYVDLFKILYNKLDYEFSLEQIFKTKNLDFINWLLWKDENEDGVINTRGKYNFIDNMDELNKHIITMIKSDEYEINYIIEVINILVDEYSSCNKTTFMKMLMEHIRNKV